jgi:hypothetical protein
MALKIIKLMEFDQSNYKQDVWLKCLTNKVCSDNIIAWQGFEESLLDRLQGKW